MTALDILQLVLYFICIIICTPILGAYMAQVFNGEKHILKPIFGWIEKLIYKYIAINPDKEDNWKSYTKGLLLFNGIGIIVVVLLQLIQIYLPLNPNEIQNVTWHSAINTAVSFVTNTNWQGYAGEITLSYFVQLVGLTVQNFVSAATGIAVLVALIKGLSRKTTQYIGNFWVDLTRAIVYVWLPLSIFFSILLVSQGVIQNFNSNQVVETIQGGTQNIPMGPAASQIAIKQLGTNGGGFFNTNSAHPFENPTPFSNFIEMFLILLIPAAMTFMYGKMVGSVKHGWIIFIVMFILLIAGLGISLYSEYSSNNIFGNTPLMEGKETRFGITNSILWATATSAASNGSVNSMIDSMSPLSGMISLLNIMLGEIIFGGVGAGLYGIVIFIILTVFIAGLMVGRSPEYLGKKVEAFEVQMAMIAVLAPNLVILIFTAWASVSDMGISSLNNSGAHGFTEILYAYSSAAGNNGSAFAGLNANTMFYNITLSICMLVGRFGVIIPVLAIAGNMSKKKITPPSAGTFHTDNWLFIGLLIGIILIVGGLTHFPALALGPIMEHLMIQ